MPAVSSFYGIIVYMYFFDTDRHHKPHIHAQYSSQEVLIEIPNGEVLSGEIQRNKMKLIQAWIEIHKEELMTNWDLAVDGHTVNPIEPPQII